ncbi:MAG: O-antigen ligase family protein [bacterium]
MEVVNRLRIIFFILFSIGLSFSISFSNISLALIILNEIAALSKERKFQYKRLPFDVIFILIIVSFFLSAVFGIDVARSLSDFKSELHFLILFLVYYNVKQEQAKALIKVFIISSVVVSAFGIFQYMLRINVSVDGVFTIPYDYLREISPKIQHYLSLWGNRIRGTRSHPITFAECVFFSFILNTAFIINSKNIKSKLFWSSGFIIQGIAIIFSYSRGVWLASVISLMLAFVLMLRKKKIYMFVFAIILVFVFLFNLKLKQRLTGSDIASRESTQIRMHLWKSAIDISKDYLIFGIGVGNLKKVYHKYQSPDITDKRAWSELHNVFLQVLVERGIAGFGIFVWLLIAIGKSLLMFYRREEEGTFNRSLSGAIMISFLGFLIFNITENALFDAEVAMIFYFIIGCSFSLFFNKSVNNNEMGREKNES